MSESFADLNRAVHLARRDACVERAMELLYFPIESMGTHERIAHVGNVIALLECALEHATRAGGSDRAIAKEHDFRHFLLLILGNVESVYAFLKNQEHLESEEHSFLTQFLGISEDEVTLSATNYHRRAEDMLMGLWQVLRMAHGPYRSLQQQNTSAFDESDRERYQRAYLSFREELMAKYGVIAVPNADAPPPAVPPTDVFVSHV